MMKLFTVLTGESYNVRANSEEEAILKFHWYQSSISEAEVEEAGFDHTQWDYDQVEEWETMTEVV